MYSKWILAERINKQAMQSPSAARGAAIVALNVTSDYNPQPFK